jgi:hypothetical protein
MAKIKLEELLATSTVTTPDQQLVVEMPEQKLAVGKYSFELIVKDDSDNLSTPAVVTVIVVDTTRPTAVADLNDEQGRIIANGRIDFGSGFILNASRSTDIGGSITEYSWRLLPN